MLKKISVAILIVAVILMLNVNVFASNDDDLVEVIDMTNSATGNNTTGNSASGNNTAGNTNTNANALNTNTNTNTNNTNRNANNTNTNTNGAGNYANTNKLPQTGIDSSILFIIAIFAISAVFAYKKIQDYNN